MKDLSREWRPVPGWEGFYEITRDGDTRSVPRKITQRNGHVINRRGRQLQHHLNGDGYPYVHLSDVANGRASNSLVHRLVALAFIPNPSHLPEVDHIDGNPLNRGASNLRWVDRATNCRAASCSKLSDSVAATIRERVAAGETQASLAREFGLHPSTIWTAVHRVNWFDGPGDRRPRGRGRERPSLEHNGERMSVAAWARKLGYPATTMRRRLRKMPTGDALRPSAEAIARSAGEGKDG